MSPSHNLKIVVLDSNNGIIENAEIVDYVYKHFADIQFRREVHWEHTTNPGFVWWNLQPLSGVESHFMGDLFTTTIHSDNLLYKLTKHILSEIEQQTNLAFLCDIKIEFHIFKFLDEYMDRDYTFLPV